MKKTVIVAIAAVGLMSVVDGIISPGYFSKSVVKLFLFLLLPVVAGLGIKDFRKLFKAGDKRELLKSILLGLGVYALIVVAYIFLSPFLDLAGIRNMLETDIGVSRDNFIIVAIYISLMNSLLEEFFFRGFIFLSLLENTTRIKAHIISAGLFAVYHVAILRGWFNPIIFVLAMAGLFIGGIIFNLLNERNGNIISSWMVHIGANLAINTVGLIMFNII
ncbi:MAG: CPBP family intramembrane glutamic endopeptidase [Gudongella sp.]|jgi:membrane protease YdiL (CAAX protease family)|nr:CPBP family intramembrane glutamic endopeptidase [Gudongella sp.]